MAATALAPSRLRPALPERYARPPSPDALAPDPATVALVRDQVQALLLASPAYHRIEAPDRRALAHNLVKVAAYAAECVRDDWYQSERRLGQRPLVVRREHGRPPAAPPPAAPPPAAPPPTATSPLAATPPPAAPRPPTPPPAVATAQADQGTGGAFKAGAAGSVGAVTKQTLNAIAFPTFVAELIRGTFDAITTASVKQMEDYGRLLGNVGRNVDDFMNQSVSDNQARDWLVERYPSHLRIEVGTAPAKRAPKARPGRPERRTPSRASAQPQATLVPVEGAEDKPLPNWRGDLGVTDKPALDTSWLEDKLVPAARRRMAQSRLQTLSTMVLMGMDRISVTGGKIRATMAFHIDASDFSREQHATDTDTRVAAAGSVGAGWWSVSASASFAYVTSSRSASQSELNVAADLGGEVEIHFTSKAFPLERMADPSSIGRIVGNTAVPSANAAISSSGEAIGWGTSAPAGPAVVPKRERDFQQTPVGTPIGEAKVPTAPTDPTAPKEMSDEHAANPPGGKTPPGSKPADAKPQQGEAEEGKAQGKAEGKAAKGKGAGKPEEKPAAQEPAGADGLVEDTPDGGTG